MNPFHAMWKWRHRCAARVYVATVPFGRITEDDLVNVSSDKVKNGSIAHYAFTPKSDQGITQWQVLVAGYAPPHTVYRQLEHSFGLDFDDVDVQQLASIMHPKRRKNPGSPRKGTKQRGRKGRRTQAVTSK